MRTKLAQHKHFEATPIAATTTLFVKDLPVVGWTGRDAVMSALNQMQLFDRDVLIVLLMSDSP